MAGKLHLRVLTPSHTMFDGDADMIVARAFEGEMAVLYGHMPITVTLSYGQMRIVNNGDTKRAAVLGGLLEVRNNQVTVISEIAEWADDIDVALAEDSRERAARDMKELTELTQLRRAELSFRRASVLLEVSSYAIIKGRGGGIGGRRPKA